MGNDPSEEQVVNDAALMSARLMALKNEDEILEEQAYNQPPPPPTVPPISPKTKRLRLLGMVCLGGILLGVGFLAGKSRTIKKFNPRNQPEVVAIVNGEPISLDEFHRACEIVTGKPSLQNLIDRKLTLQLARKKGVLPTPQMVDARLAEISNQPNFPRQLKQANQSMEDFKQTLLYQLAKTAIIDQGVHVSNAEIHGYYLKNNDPKKNPQARFYHPETVTIAVILSKNIEDIHNAQQELANRVPFATAVARYSHDIISSKNMGILPPLRRGSINAQKFPGLEKILFDTLPPAQLEPMNFGGNWWLIRVLAHNQESIDPYEKVMDVCRNSVLLAKGVTTNGQALTLEKQDFLKNAKIDIRIPEYKDVMPIR